MHIKDICDKVKIKLATWKSDFLSNMGRVQLIKSIMLAYSFSIFALKTKQPDGWFKNLCGVEI